MTKHETILITAFTGILCCEISDFHAFVEQRIGQPVWTHEMGSPAFWAEIRDAVRDEFLSLCQQASNPQVSGPPSGGSTAPTC